MESTYRSIPLKGLRGIIARKMTESAAAKPHVTLTTRVDAAPLLAARELWAERLAPEGLRVTVTALLARLTAVALSMSPRVNGRLEEGEIRIYDRVHLGVAVALDEGLVVPVIREADRKSLPAIVRELQDLVSRARMGRLKPWEMGDATFTLSNLGAYGVDHFTPIINPPEIAVLGVGGVRPELCLEGGIVAERTMMGLSLSFDHAAVDGAQAATCLREIARAVETPADLIQVEG